MRRRGSEPVFRFITLQQWVDFLRDQIRCFDAAYLVKTGHPHIANPALVAFLQVNDAMASEKIERAIAAFVEDNAWPAWLSGDQLVNLTHRANSAKGLLEAIVSGQVTLDTLRALQAPPPQQRSRFIGWLLVDLWKIGGSAYLKALTDAYLSTDQSGR